MKINSVYYLECHGKRDIIQITKLYLGSVDVICLFDSVGKFFTKKFISLYTTYDFGVQKEGITVEELQELYPEVFI